MKLFFALISTILFSSTIAQNAIPKNYKKGELVLLDSTHLKGFIKESIKTNAAISFISSDRGKKKEFNGNDLLSISIDSTEYLCIHGDFFKVLTDGDLAFIQKYSDASNIPVYNGTEAAFLNGTEGKQGDYFVYEKRAQKLRLVSKKNMKALASSIFNGYAPALAMVEKANSQIPQFKEAINLYNKRFTN